MSDETNAHSLLSPSKAKRWMTCPGSVVLSKDLPEDPGNKYTAEGTAAHELAEIALSEGRPAEAYLGRVLVVEADQKYEFEVDTKMAANVQSYIDYVYRETESLVDDVTRHFELEVDLSHLLGPGEKGTADCVAIADGVLHVIDLKYGQGVRVEVHDNPQLLLYAAGAARALKHDGPVRIHVVQPRLGHFDSQHVEPVVLSMFARQASEAADTITEALTDYPPPGSHKDLMTTWECSYLKPEADACKWCQMKATCPALPKNIAATILARNVATVTEDDFDDLTGTEKAHIPSAAGEALSVFMAKVDLIEDWAAAVRKEVHARLMRGEAIDGWKLVRGRDGNSAWKNVDEAEKTLKSFRFKQNEMYESKLISPTTAKKLVEKEPKRLVKLMKLITRPKGQPVVVPASDSRPAYEPETVKEEDFEDLTA